MGIRWSGLQGSSNLSQGESEGLAGIVSYNGITWPYDDEYQTCDGYETADEKLLMSGIRKRNRESFESLRRKPEFQNFFSFHFPDMKVGKKIRTGSIADIYEGEFTLGMQIKFPCVLKIMNKVFDVTSLQERWPEGMLKGGNSVFPGYFSGTTSILGGLLLEDAGKGGRFDGRFAIVLRREWGDLRQLIDLRMGVKDLSAHWSEIDKIRNEYKGPPPFSNRCAKKMMLEIAVGMRQLHNHGILHRDLKSLNVMVSGPHPREFPIEDDAFHVKVYDFETSVGTVGSWVFRAPEILQALKNKTFYANFIFTTKQDVYSYAMTCYEILIGLFRFDDERESYRDKVINGERPKLPHGMDKWLRELIEQCWHNDPSMRPEFEDIVKVFKHNFSDPTAQSSVEEQIKASAPHWSQLSDKLVDLDSGETNQAIFARLKVEPKYAKFFSYEFRNLERGRKIAEGAQGQVFEAEFEKANGLKVPCVLKIFNSGFSLSDMKNQWPPGMFERRRDPSERQSFGFMGLYPNATRTCEVLGAVVLEDDRFAFIFNREGGDLRRLIDLRMKQVSQTRPGEPFTLTFATKIIYEIAQGMLHLHNEEILHRDLKAANVLVTNVYGEFPSEVSDGPMNVKVADFECSMLAVGTKFWRAPEILKQLRVGPNKKLVFTKEADVYSYGMTCYEVLTGGVPLEDRGFKPFNTKAVYEGGERPILPNRIDGWLRKLITRCWDAEASKRPDFKEIIQELERNCLQL